MNVIIWSVNPNRVFLDRGPMGEFFAEPAAEKDPKTVDKLGRTLVTDISQNVYHGKRDFKGNPEYVLTTTPGEQIAKDLVDRDRENLLHGNSGIFIAAGPAPTPEEIEKAKEGLRIHAQHEFDLAESLWNSGGRNRMVISDLARRSAGYLGHAPEWMSRDATGNKACGFCAETIKSQAIVCKHCGRDVAPLASVKRPAVATSPTPLQAQA